MRVFYVLNIFKGFICSLFPKQNMNLERLPKKGQH